MDEVISQRHLVLVLRFIQGFIKHNDVGRFGIKFVKVALHFDWNGVSELLGLADSKDFSPIGL